MKGAALHLYALLEGTATRLQTLQLFKEKDEHTHKDKQTIVAKDTTVCLVIIQGG
jgi:hypothetical protein